jgi:hypothetical protein
MDSYPHTCQMDHEKIGYSSEGERCPLCRQMDGNDQLNRENAGLRAHIAELEAERDRYMRALVHIKANAETQLHAQSATGTPEDAPEAINARFNYAQANDALKG